MGMGKGGARRTLKPPPGSELFPEWWFSRNQKGYWVCTSPKAARGIYLHRAVMGLKEGREIEPWEEVHHKDADRGNCHPDNLELLGRKEHMETLERCPWTGRWLRTKGIEEGEGDDAFKEMVSTYAKGA